MRWNVIANSVLATAIVTLLVSVAFPSVKDVGCIACFAIAFLIVTFIVLSHLQQRREMEPPSPDEPLPV
jgi:hypothetical protein